MGYLIYYYSWFLFIIIHYYCASGSTIYIRLVDSLIDFGSSYLYHTIPYPSILFNTDCVCVSVSFSICPLRHSSFPTIQGMGDASVSVFFSWFLLPLIFISGLLSDIFIFLSILSYPPAVDSGRRSQAAS